MNRLLCTLLLLPLSFIGCGAQGKHLQDKQEKNEVRKENPPTTNFLLRNRTGHIEKWDLRNPGLISKNLGLKIRHISRSGGIERQFDGNNATQFVLSDTEDGGIYLRVVGDQVSFPNGIRVGMDFDSFTRIANVKCEALCEAKSIVSCVLPTQLVGNFSPDTEKLCALSPNDRENINSIKSVLEHQEVTTITLALPSLPLPTQLTKSVREQGILPAGVQYFRGPYTVCSNTRWSAAKCDVPTIAVIDGIYDEKRARERLKQIGVGTAFSPGYPLAVHTDELGLEKKHAGIVLVLGLFVEETSAREWKRRIVPQATLEKLIDTKAFLRGPRKQVVRVRLGSSVQGYTKRPLATKDSANSKKSEPQCWVRAGSFVVSDGFVGYSDSAMPARCENGDPTRVRLQDTLLYSMVGEDRNGATSLWQLTGVECDVPSFMVWSLNNDGKTTKQEPAQYQSDC